MTKTADIRTVLVAAMLVICVAAAGCRKQNQPSTRSAQNGIVAIGVVGGMDANAKSEIKATLRAHGIEPIPEGSFVSGVLVSSKEQAEQAMRILSEDSKRKYCWEFLER